MNKGEIWLAKLSSLEGREQSGQRPVLLMNSPHTNMVMAIPLTSIVKAENYEFTLRINNSSSNGLQKDSVALVFQLRAMDKRKLSRKTGNIETENLDKIDELVKNLLEFRK